MLVKEDVGCDHPNVYKKAEEEEVLWEEDYEKEERAEKAKRMSL